jgi:DNA-binding CsgD family transcriptional regulator
MWIEPAQWHLLETLVPHLQRAAEVHRLLARSTAITDSLGQAFAAAGFAVFLVTEDCRILFNNARAEDLLRRRAGVQYSWGRLAATDHAVGERLQALVRAGAKTLRGTGNGGGTLELRRDDESRPLIAHVIPLAPVRTLDILDLERPAAAIFVVDPGADLLGRVRHFAARFGLTSAEIRVLAEIIGGSRTHVAAENLKIAEGTVRTHAKRILAKTGTTRQSELIRRFFETSLQGTPNGW